MATDPTEGPSVPLAERVRNILMTPKTEWPRIDSEPATIGGIYRGYVVILAAIPPVAMAFGLLLVGFGFFGGRYVIGMAVMQYLLGLAGVYVLALIIEALAPSFGGTKDRLKAFKLVAYSSTAAWVAGAAMVIPVLGALVALIGGLYSLYLLYLGLPVLMKVAQDKVVPYVVVTILAAIVVWWLIGMIAASLAMSLVGYGTPAAIGYPLPG